MIIFRELMLTSVLTALALSLPGVFLVLRGNTLVTFALSHSLLFGIMVMFLITGDADSPVLILGAAATAFGIVLVVEGLSKAKHVKSDAALGMVYLFIFSLGIILVSLYASGTNLSVVSVVTGNMALVPFNRLVLFDFDLGPKLLWGAFAVLVLNIAFLSIFYKELKISIFDPDYAFLVGFSPFLFHILFMGVVSLTVVTVFKVAGVVLVVALMILPPSSAYLMSKNLSQMILLSTLISISSAVIGFIIAWKIEKVEIASVIAIVNALVFFISTLLSHQGFVGNRS